MLPIVGALLAQGLGILGNAVLSKGKAVIEEKLGVDIESSLGTEEGRLSLKQLEVDHEEFLLTTALEDKKLDLRSFELELKDKDSARSMQETALSQDDLFAKRFVYYYALGITAASLVYIGAITFVQIPETNIRFADTILGFIIGTFLTTVIQFFYGSSRASQSKDTVISNLSKEVSK
jgi:hypothetical protein